MRTCGVQFFRGWRFLLAAILPTLALSPVGAWAQNKPTGTPLELSSIETEQEVPLAILTPDGKIAKCVPVRLHWISKPDIGPDEDAINFTLDLPADNPVTPIFSAQLWNASLASALAWQQPWQGARWKVLQTPETDGSGIDAALAVGMIATSARRPYPPKTVVIGSLNPDGSLGPVSRLVDRINAAAQAGMTRVIIPSVQRFDTDAAGNVVNVVRQAGDLHIECIPVDDLKTAIETTMNDPLPDTVATNTSIPKYSNDVSSYIDDFARREQTEATSGMKFAPAEANLSTYPLRLAATWKSIYADYEAAQQAYGAGQVYVAYQLFARINGRMNGANALSGQTRTSFDVKTALSESDDLHDHLHVLMNPPSIDRGGLESAVLVSEMADWAFEVNASLEGAQLVTKQAFSQRSDATEAEKDRAREAILFANEQCKYLLTQANFYTGLLGRIAHGNPINVDANASHFLPQLIPAQLATARSFTEGIRASELRDGLLFDPRLVAYVNVLREAKSDWDAHQRKKDSAAAAAANTPAAAPAPASPDATPTKLNSNAEGSAVGFDPGDTYQPPHTVLDPATVAKKLSNAALCLIWVNHDCEIATLDEKYLRLNGAMDPATHEWHVKDRPKLDALLQLAEIGARQGIAFAEKTEIDPSVLAMIYEKASHERTEGSDTAALDGLRNYWRCALLGNMCWQLAHTHKAQPVLVQSGPPAKNGKKGEKPKASETTETAGTPAASTNTVVTVSPHGTTSTNVVAAPAAPSASTNTDETASPPVAPIATNDIVNVMEPPASTNADTVVVAPAPTTEVHAPKEPAVTNAAPVAIAPVTPSATAVTNQAEQPAQPPSAPMAKADDATNAAPTPPPPTPPPATAADDTAANIPVAPIAKAADLTTGETPPATNAVPIGPIPPSATPPAKPVNDNADAHAF